MLGLQYDSHQYYYYKDHEKLKQILKWDPIGEVTLYEDENTIKYKIDRSKHVRLSDLIELIEIGFIRFHLGQLLVLFIELLQKVKLMEGKSIAHNYLREDRIWLNLKNQTSFSITYQTIQYDISFTGYQSKCYDDLALEEVADSKKILQIISQIITNFKIKNIVLNKAGNSKDQIISNIYEPIYKSCQKGKIEDTINQVEVLLTKYSYSAKDQTVSFDDRLLPEGMYSKRKHQKKIIEQQLQNLITKLDQIPLVTEQYLLAKIKEVRANLKNWLSLELNENDEQQKYHNMLIIYETKKKQIQQSALTPITQYVENIVINKYEVIFKQKMEQSQKDIIINSVLGIKLLNYFENNKNIFEIFDQGQYLKLMLDFGVTFIEDYINNYIQFQILILIEELI